MSALNRRMIYGRIVPALAILLGLSYAFIDVEAVHRVLLAAVAGTAALGWLAPSGRERRRRGAVLPGPQDAIPGERPRA